MMKAQRCSVEGCEEFCSARGYCYRHYRDIWWKPRHNVGSGPRVKAEVQCATEGCGRVAAARGLCPSCYTKAWKEGSITVRAHQPRDCVVPGCCRPPKAKNLCSLHYSRKRMREISVSIAGNDKMS